jgi:hypothetical protein
VVYGGSGGLLRRGDLIHCSDRSFDSVRVGDVIVFRRGPGDRGGLVVHRVVRILQDGRLETAGDGCAAADPGSVGRDDFVCVAAGRSRGRGGAALPLPGGRAGLAQSAASRGMYRIRRALGGFVPGYSGFIGRSVRRFWKPRLDEVVVRGRHGPEIRYAHRGRPVARWIPGIGVFRCRRAYTLFVEPPGGSGSGRTC